MVEVVIYGGLFVSGFILGVLFGRKNKQKVEQALREANEAHSRVVDQLELAKSKLTRKKT